MRHRLRKISKPSALFRQMACSLGCSLGLAMFLYPIGRLLKQKRPSCQSNLKQTGLALRLYAEDWDGHLPCAAHWMDDTNRLYAKNWGIFRCPEVTDSQPTSYGYAFNSLLAQKSLKKLKRLETLPMIYDTGDLRRNAFAPGHSGLANPPRHHGGNNIGYADGHVKWN